MTRNLTESPKTDLFSQVYKMPSFKADTGKPSGGTALQVTPARPDSEEMPRLKRGRRGRLGWGHLESREEMQR